MNYVGNILFKIIHLIFQLSLNYMNLYEIIISIIMHKLFLIPFGMI
jgi:hypothetical protein